MSILNYIIWNFNPDIIDLGRLTIRWYGVLFALGFIIGQQIIYYIYKKEGKPEKDVETLTIFMVVATILGARLGHVLFYQPGEYLRNPINIIKIWEGGLASHGAAFGILLALFLYSNYYINISFKEVKVKKQTRKGQGFLWVVDRIVIVVALAGCLIRLGNFMNSEIIGTPTGSNYGVVFAWDAQQDMEKKLGVEDVSFRKPATDTVPSGDFVPVIMEVKFGHTTVNEDVVKGYIQQVIPPNINAFSSEHLIAPDPLQYQLNQRRNQYVAQVALLGIARHPSQLYESISSLLLFFFLFLYWKRNYKTMPDGRIFGIFLIVLFGLRFLYEFIKMPQVEFEREMALNMGQWLSIPLILAGIIILIWTSRKGKTMGNEEKA